MEEKKEWYEIVFPYMMVSICMVIIFVVIYKLGWNQRREIIQFGMIVSIVLILGYGILQWVNNKLDTEQIIGILILAGFVMRIGYMLYTPIQTRSHDLGDLSTDGYGHAAYILTILKKHRLPDSNMIQFYHPPLFHALAAYTCQMMNYIMQFTEYKDILEIGKLVSCSASCWTLLLVPPICSELILEKNEKIFVVGMMAFFPEFLLIGGRLNNDSLVLFFQMMIILYTFRWFRKQSWENTIILALAFGFGLMTKASCATLAIFTAPFMCIKLMDGVKRKEGCRLFIKTVVFGMISMPLGLWFHIRNYILFQQPFGYVLEIGKESRIYTGDVSFADRFLRFPFSELFNPTYAHPLDDYNIPLYIVKNSLFGEFEYDIMDCIPHALVLINVLLIVMSVVAMIWTFVKRKSNKSIYYGMFYLWLIVYGSFLYFNYKYPYGCTMDFRYIPVTVFIGSVFLSVFCKWRNRIIQYMARSVTVIFSMLSFWFFCFVR